MKPVFRLARVRRRLALARDLFKKLVAGLIPRAREVRSQRMCPFCGLITSRAKMSCLECGRMLNPV
jgi:hypothetical protein